MQRKISRLVAALLTIGLLSGPAVGKGFLRGAIYTSSSPLSLPLATQSNFSPTFLGSFKLPSGYSWAAGMSVSGSTLYVAEHVYDPADSAHYTLGMAAVTLPSLSSPAAYDGSNATASQLYAPSLPTTYVAPATYTATITPTTGAVTATFSSLPAGIAGGQGWYAYFENSSGSLIQDVLVTGVNGNTITFSPSLSSATYGANVQIHQWNPSIPWGQSDGYKIAGSMVSGGKLYMTGGTYYDGTCSDTGAQGTISGNVLTLTHAAGSLPVTAGMIVSGTGVPAYTYISAILSGPLAGAAVTTQPSGTLTNGTYTNVSLSNDSSSGTGAVATITVSGGVVSNISGGSITTAGSGYAIADTLYMPQASIPGATSNGVVTVTSITNGGDGNLQLANSQGTAIPNISTSQAFTFQANVGWILSANTDISASSWGIANTATGYSYNPSGLQPQEYSRRYAGVISPVPSTWQSLLGGPAFVGSGLGLSVLSCSVPPGPSFSVFDPSGVSSTGGSVSVTPALDYWTTGLQKEPGASPYSSLSYRSFAGPFPNPPSGPYNGTYTITSGNGTGPNGLTGATAFTLTSPFPNNGGTTGFLDTTSTATTGTDGNDLVATAPTGGWPQSWAANYWVGGQIYDLTRNSDCRPDSSTAVTAGNAGTITLHCPETVSMQSGDQYALTFFSSAPDAPYEVTFSDGEQRLVQMLYNSTSAPDPSVNVFATLTGCSSGQCSNTALTCTSCTTSVTIAPLGDAYSSEYDGPLGTEFIDPGSSSLLVLTMHQFGLASGRPYTGECGGGASGSNNLPVPPDTTVYMAPQIFAYKMQDIYNQEKGTGNIWTANPYSTWDFPGYANWTSATNGCVSPGAGIGTGSIGWATYDPVGGILYVAVAYSSNNEVVEEYSIPSL